MSKQILFLCQVSGVMLIASCAITPPATNETQQQTAHAQAQPGTATPALPDWVRNPELQGYEVVIGTAPKQAMGGIEVQRQVAQTMAHQELAYRLRAQVKATDWLYVKGDESSPELTQEVQVSAQAGYKVNDFIVDKEWIDPESGTLFLRMMVPLQSHQ